MNKLEINCPECTREINASTEVNLSTGLAKCSPCNLVFQFGSNSQRPSHNFIKRTIGVNEVDIKEVRDSKWLELSFKWKTNYFMLIFAGFWNFIVFMVFGTVAWATIGEQGVSGLISKFFNTIVEEPFLLLFSAHPIVGIITGYYAISSIINRTYIYVDRKSIETFNKPLPWPFGAKKISVNEVHQLYVQKYCAYTQNDVPVYRYKVVCRTKRGKDIDFLKGVPTYAQALRIEQQAEGYLGIRDEQIAEEHQAG